MSCWLWRRWHWLVLLPCCVGPVWAQRGGGASADLRPPSVREDSPQVLLALLGVDSSFLNNLQDGFPPGEEEVEFFTRLVYVMRRFDRLKLLEYAQDPGEKLAQAWRQVARHRGDVFALEGRLLAVDQQQVSRELTRLTGVERYWICRLELFQPRWQALVVVEHVPRSWERRVPVGDRVACQGFFVKRGSQEGQAPLPVFVAKHLAWYPSTLLGQLGVDAARWERARAWGPLTSRDTEPFYQLLGALKRIDTRRLLPHVLAARQIVAEDPQLRKYQHLEANALWLRALLQRPGRYRGCVLQVRGQARRAVRIAVESELYRRLYALDHYWELEVFLDTGIPLDVHGEPVSSYPVVVCVPRLPPQFPQGEAINEPVEAVGVLFKLWSYRSALAVQRRPAQFLRQADLDRDGRISLQELLRLNRQGIDRAALQELFGMADRNRNHALEQDELAWLLGRQTAPLLLAPELIWHRPQRSANTPLAVIGGAVVLLGLVMLAVVLYRVNRSDDELSRRVRKELLLAGECPLPDPPPAQQENGRKQQGP